MKIRIKRKQKPTLWYEIGEIYDVLDEWEDYYTVEHPNNRESVMGGWEYVHSVFKSDCEVIK